MSDEPNTNEPGGTLATGNEPQDPVVNDGDGTPDGDTPSALTAESYKDLKLGDDAVVQENYLDKLKEFALERGITPEQAQAIAEWQSASNAELMQVLTDAQHTQLREAQNKWETELKKESGFDALLADCQRGFQVGKDVQGFDEMIKILDDSGLGSHPAFVRYFAKVGKLLAEPDIVNGPASGAPSNSGKTAAEVLYPETGK